MPAYTKKELCDMWKRPPERQIAVMQSKILEAFKRTNGKIAIAWSGGKDSSYLVYKAAQIWAQQPYWTEEKKPLMVCFADTTNEHKQTRKFIKTFPPYVEEKFDIKIELHITRPKNNQTFVTVAQKKGLPLISKNVSMGVRKLRRALHKAHLKFEDIVPYAEPTMDNVNKLIEMGLPKTGILTLTGYSFKSRKFGSHFKLAKRWLPLVPAEEIAVSEECCGILKKHPMAIMMKSLGDYQPMIGEMAQDSEQREKAYLANGCNSFHNGKGKSKPMGPMTEQGVLFGINYDNVPMSEYYGKLVCENCQYRFIDENRGGCALCGFGIEFEPDRFIKLQKYEPAKVKLAFKPKSEGGLGYLEACEFLNEYCKCKIQIPFIPQ